jgi:hypothetical protein
LTQQLNRPQRQGPAISGWGLWFSLLTVLSLFAIFIGMLVGYLPQVVRFAQSSRSSVSQLPESARGPLPRSVVYEQTGQLWIISAWNGAPRKVSAPGYIYSRAVPPLFTPSGQLVYSGNGVWLTNPFSGHPKQIARLSAGQIITSLALSQDGSQLAWTSAPVSGKGTINLYAGPLEATVLVHQQPANLCPCFRVFSFWHDSASLADKTLLLTEDHGDHETVQHGLWIFNLHEGAAAQPRQLLASDPPQGPLALAPDDSHLLYASWEGYTPTPGDKSLPDDAQALSYANDLNIAAIDTQVPKLAPSQVIVHRQPLLQPEAMTSSTYHWIMTPCFSPDGHTLAYLEFTNNVYALFSRSSKIYIVNVNDSGTQLTLGSPLPIAVGNSGYSELGGWIDEHHLVLYANGELYTLDVQHARLMKIILTKGYVQIIGTVARG